MRRLRLFNEWLNKTGASANPGPLLRFTLLFICVFFLLQWAYPALAGTAAYRFYLETLTVQASSALIQWIAPHDGVLARSHRLLWPSGGLTLYNGCDGAEAMKLLLTAFIVVAGPWRARLRGAALGLLLIYILNQARIVALYFAVRYDRAWFELLHGMIGPLIIIALATLFFAWWINKDEPVHTA